MAFRVKCTGTNLCYGKKGEIKILGEAFVLVAMKRGWIENKIKYVGHQRPDINPYKGTKPMPFRKIDLIRIVKIKKRQINKMDKTLKAYIKTLEQMIRLLEENKNDY